MYNAIDAECGYLGVFFFCLSKSLMLSFDQGRLLIFVYCVIFSRPEMLKEKKENTNKHIFADFSGHDMNLLMVMEDIVRTADN